MAARRKVYNKPLILKFKPKFFYSVFLLIAIFLSLLLVFYFPKHQEKNEEYKKVSTIKQDENYWRLYGESVFNKMKKISNGSLTGETAKEFQNDANLALAYFNKAIELNTDNYDNWLALAEFQDFLIPYVPNSERDAVASYLHIIKFFPKNNNVMRRAVRVLIIASDKAVLLSRNKDANDSLVIADELSKSLIISDPVNLYGTYYEALIARRQKRFDFATSTLEQIKPLLNKEPDLYFELGMAYFETNQPQKAKNNFEIASDLSDIYKKNSEMYLIILNNEIKKTSAAKNRS